MRLARNGYRCQVLRSTTYEEAPVGLMAWIRQRTRWLKGYVQTWLVHMRAPGTRWRELGPGGFLAFQVMVGGTVLSALVHPWFYVLACFELAPGAVLARPARLFGWPFWLIAWFDLAAGYLATMGLGLLAVASPRLPRAAQTDSVDAGLLVVGRGGGLSGAVPVHDRALRVGED